MTGYPHAAGWKDRTVSRENARSQQPRFTKMKQIVLNLYRSGFVGTADEAADSLSLSPFSTRPRCTELVKLGLLVKVRIDRSRPGHSAWVLRLYEPSDSLDDGQPDEQQEWNDYDPDC